MPQRHRALAFGPLEALMALSLAVGAAFVLVPRGDAARMMAREEPAHELLRRVADAERAFRAQRRLDSDHDGAAEYGSLEDLAEAGLSPGTVVRTAGDPGDVPHLEAHGYRFEVLLPAGAARASIVALVRAGAPHSAALAARRFAAVAVPLPSGEGGLRCFYVDAEGRLFAAEGVTDPDRAPVVPLPRLALDREASDPHEPGPIWRQLEPPPAPR